MNLHSFGKNLHPLTSFAATIFSNFSDLTDYLKSLKPQDRFSLSSTELSGKALKAARSICLSWGNDQWISQSPLPGLSPIDLADPTKMRIVRQMASITQVKEGETTPEGYPAAVLQALAESIGNRRTEISRTSSSFGWSQKTCLPVALELLKGKLGITHLPSNSNLSDLPPESSEKGSRVIRNGKKLRIKLKKGNDYESDSSSLSELSSLSDFEPMDSVPATAKTSSVSRQSPDFPPEPRRHDSSSLHPSSSLPPEASTSTSTSQVQSQSTLSRLTSLSSASRLSKDDISQIKDVLKVLEGIVERHEKE